MVLELYSKSFQCILIFLRIFFLNIYTYIYIHFAIQFCTQISLKCFRTIFAVFFFFCFSNLQLFCIIQGSFNFFFLILYFVAKVLHLLFFYLYVKFLTLFLQFASPRKIFKYIKLFLIIIRFDFFSVVTIFLVSSAELKSSKTRFSNRPTDLLAIHT